GYAVRGSDWRLTGPPNESSGFVAIIFLGAFTMRRAAIDMALEPAHHHQDEKRGKGAQNGCDLAAHAGGDSHSRRHPDTGSSGQSLDDAVRVLLQNGTCPKEANAGDDALQHPAGVLNLHSAAQGYQNEKRGTQRHHHVRAQAGFLASPLAVVAD